MGSWAGAKVSACMRTLHCTCVWTCQGLNYQHWPPRTRGDCGAGTFNLELGAETLAPEMYVTLCESVCIHFLRREFSFHQIPKGKEPLTVLHCKRRKTGIPVNPLICAQRIFGRIHRKWECWSPLRRWGEELVSGVLQWTVCLLDYLNFEQWKCITFRKLKF